MSTLPGINYVGIAALATIVGIQLLYKDYESFTEYFSELDEESKVTSAIPNLNQVGSNNMSNKLAKDKLNNATPTSAQLGLAGSGSDELPGPGQFAASSGSNNSRADNLDLPKLDTTTFGSGLASSLLPKKPENTEGFETTGFENVLAGQNFLSASAQIGLDTVSGSNKNAYVGLRSEPPNPTKVVSPWGNTSVEPDLLRRPLELPESNFAPNQPK